jgi:hypothetical protein
MIKLLVDSQFVDSAKLTIEESVFGSKQSASLFPLTWRSFFIQLASFGLSNFEGVVLAFSCYMK